MMKTLLENLYAHYNHRPFVPPDPLQFAYRYSDRRDVEIAAFLASASWRTAPAARAPPAPPAGYTAFVRAGPESMGRR